MNKVSIISGILCVLFSVFLGLSLKCACKKNSIEIVPQFSSNYPKAVATVNSNVPPVVVSTLTLIIQPTLIESSNTVPSYIYNGNKKILDF